VLCQQSGWTHPGGSKSIAGVWFLLAIAVVDASWLPAGSLEPALISCCLSKHKTDGVLWFIIKNEL